MNRWSFLHRFAVLLVLLPISLSTELYSALEGPANPYAIPTFECLGLYWTPAEGSETNTCEVIYCPRGTHDWRKALPLWFDKRNGEYRGSIVGLKPDTSYEIKLSLADGKTSESLIAATWSEDFPVARTEWIKSADFKSGEPLVITQGGTEEGYVLYAPADGDHGSITSVIVRAPYVILRGLAIKGSLTHGIELQDPAHHVVIENCDISGWGRKNDQGFGINYDAGVYSKSRNLQAVVIQRNHIHHPRYSSNTWLQMRSELKDQAQLHWKGDNFRNHPLGPQAVAWAGTQGQHVIRYNNLVSDEQHAWNDALGGWGNSSARGFPGPDCDIYGNLIRNAFDDGVEAEGTGRNVRIWGNYFDLVHQSVATVTVVHGPLYVFRNVVFRTRVTPTGEKPYGSRSLGKVGSHMLAAELGYGRQYWFHNTILQPGPLDGAAESFGSNVGIAATSDGVVDLISHNNILHVYGRTERVIGRADQQETISVPDGLSIMSDYKQRGSNLFDYDLYNGAVLYGEPDTEKHGIRGVPKYAPGNGPESAAGGMYQLDAQSAGFDAGKRLPNFNDGFQGEAPDIGAHEAGAPRMEFGVGAYLRRGTP